MPTKWIKFGRQVPRYENAQHAPTHSGDPAAPTDNYNMYMPTTRKFKFSFKPPMFRTP